MKSFAEYLKSLLKEDDVFWNNEVKANIFASWVLMFLVFVDLISLVLAKVGVFEVPMSQMGFMVLNNVPVLLLAIVICQLTHGQKPWVKYVMCIASLFTAIAMTSIISIFVTLIFAVPVVLSVRYYDQKRTTVMAVLTDVAMAFGTFLYSRHGMIGLNLIPTAPGSVLQVTDSGLRDAILQNGYSYPAYISNLLRGEFAPRLLLLSIISIICVELARRAHETILEQEAITAKTEGMKKELDMATAIQTAVLPKTFPAFPERPDIELHSSMTPAKEVGGDFYDYYQIDPDHIGIVIADVSGKGVPAALYMMVSRILIKTHMFNTLSPVETAKRTNEQLCSNDSGMFVTAWIGVLDLKTNIITAVNAGHEHPAVRRANGAFDLIRSKPCFVLGGMEGIPYREYTFAFNPGDSMFLYTDGVTEATDSNLQLFGIDRVLETLNKNPEANADSILANMKQEIDAFVGSAPQFDDLTMVAVKYTGLT